MKTLKTLLTTFAMLAIVGVLFLPALARAADLQHETTREFIDRMDTKFAGVEKESAEEEGGNGFEPYQRYRWFMMRRLEGQEDIEPGARWNAWEQMRQQEQQFGTLSETWFSLGPTNVSGRCLAIEVHPTDSNTAYAGFASGGLWKTTDAGATWTPLGDQLPSMSVGAIEIDPADPDHMWIGTGEGWGNIDAIHGVGVLESFDGGVTWGTTGYSYDISQGRDVFELEYNPSTGTFMVAADNGLWRSTDGLVSFTEVMPSGQWRDVELKHGSSSIMFASCSNGSPSGFYRSLDDGETWTQMTVGTPTSGISNNRFALTDADPDVIYWAIASGDVQKGIWKSTDGGDSFSQVYFGTGQYGQQGWYDLTIDVSPLDPDIVWSGGVNCYRSTNGAVTFSQVNGIHVDHHATAWAPSDPTNLWVGSDGGVYRSTSSGTSFSNLNHGLTTLQFYAVNQSETLPTRALGGTQDNGTYQYDNSLSWQHVIGGDGFYTEIDRSDANVEYGELYYGDHRRSLNGGGSFQSINTGITEDGPWSTPTWMDYSNSNNLWTAHNTKLFHTTDRGSHWSQVPGISFAGGGRNMNQSLNHPDVIGLVTSKVYVSPDHGVTWNDVTSFGTLGLSDIAIGPDNPDLILVTHATYLSTVPRVRKSTDGGLTWSDADNGLPQDPVNTIEIDPQHEDWYFAGTDLGVYVTFDGGANWLPFNTGLPHVVISDLRLHNSARLLRAGSYGRGMWEVDISGLTPTATSVAGAPHPTVQPITLRVLNNPSADVSTLRFGIRQPGHVLISLYDATGRLVEKLVDQDQPAILGSVDVNLRDLTPGVYFARMEANGATMSTKLVVQK